MAQQHFYSRVPARLSAFNRTDGFDTFASSSGLYQDFMEKELSVVYDVKPTKAEADLIRNGKLPPVYFQYMTKDSVLIQSCMSFLPLDYTGERSSYLVHSLILTDKEKKTVLSSDEKDCIDPDLFEKDLSFYDFSSFDAHVDMDYPEKDYECEKSTDIKKLCATYDSGMLKRLIYALINTACGKTKSVFVYLPVNVSHLSSAALDFMNSVMRIFPPHIRRKLSFATYIGDTARLPSFKVKFLPEGYPEAPTAKGVSVHFGTKVAAGIQDENVAANGRLIEFFYSLFVNGALRSEFMKFVDFALDKKDELSTPSLKNLTDLVFLFETCSGMFSENQVLPNDDRVYDFMCTYEKYRGAMTDEFRSSSMKCLKRYPASHNAIPKNVFSKVTKLYPGEIIASKRTVMSVVLDLIHTDIMRDKLFKFIETNYEEEDSDIRRTINADLCRVYYGGFLQPQILDFFTEHFEGEPEETRTAVVEKLLLTVRTPAISDGIVAFFGKYYDLLDETQKIQFYQTYFEMLPAGDDVASKLSDVVNAHIGNETEAVRDEVRNKLYTFLENDQRRKEPKLLAMIMQSGGFLSEAATLRILTAWRERKIFSDFVDGISAKPLSERTDAFISIIRSPIEDEKVTSSLTEPLTRSLPASSYKLREAADAVDKTNSALSESGISPACKKLGDAYVEKFLIPAFCKAIPQAFNYRADREGLEFVFEFAKTHPSVKDSDEYKLVENSFDAEKSIREKDYKTALSLVSGMQSKQVRAGLGERLTRRLSDEETGLPQSEREGRMFTIAFAGLLTSNAPAFKKAYDKAHSEITSEKNASGAYKAGSDALLFDSDRDAVSEAVSLGALFHAGEMADDLKDQTFSSGSELFGIISAFCGKYSKRAGKALDAKLLEDGISADAEYVSFVRSAMNVSSSSKGIFGKLFKRQ